MTPVRTWMALAASLLTPACASSGVELRSPHANFSKAQAVLVSVATAQGLQVAFVTHGYSGSGYPGPRPVIEVFMPGAPVNVRAHTTPLVYTLEVGDLAGRLTFWIAVPEYAAPLCQALLVAEVPFEVTDGADLAPECAAP